LDYHFLINYLIMEFLNGAYWHTGIFIYLALVKKTYSKIIKNQKVV